MEDNTIQAAVEEFKLADETKLREIIEQWFETVRTQGMKIGAGFISAAVYGIIQKHTKKTSKVSLRDYERMTAEIVNVISVQLNTQQNDSEETTDDGRPEEVS